MIFRWTTSSPHGPLKHLRATGVTLTRAAEISWSEMGVCVLDCGIPLPMIPLTDPTQHSNKTEARPATPKRQIAPSVLVPAPFKLVTMPPVLPNVPLEVPF